MMNPVEVWLSRTGALSVSCTVVHDDESTEKLDVDSLSMRGAQREITGFLRNHWGYEPVDRWQVEAEDCGPVETSRRFRPRSK